MVRAIQWESTPRRCTVVEGRKDSFVRSRQSSGKSRVCLRVRGSGSGGSASPRRKVKFARVIWERRCNDHGDCPECAAKQNAWNPEGGDPFWTFGGMCAFQTGLFPLWVQVWCHPPCSAWLRHIDEARKALLQNGRTTGSFPGVGDATRAYEKLPEWRSRKELSL